MKNRKNLTLALFALTFLVLLGASQLSHVFKPHESNQRVASVATSQQSIPSLTQSEAAHSELVRAQRATTDPSQLPAEVLDNMNVLEVLAADEIETASGEIEIHSVIKTDSILGKVLVKQNRSTGKVRKYRAEHLVVSPTGNNTELTELAALLRESGFEVHQPYEFTPFLYLTLKGHTPQEIRKTLEEVTSLLSDTDAVIELDGIGRAAGANTIPPNDPDYNDQWHHQKIQSEAAWGMTKGSDEVLVAVLDTGLADLRFDPHDFHVICDSEEFADRIHPNAANFLDYLSAPLDESDDHHGTAMTSILAANANNKLYGAGIDWKCQIMPLKVMDNSGYVSNSQAATAIEYALSYEADVILMGFANSEYSFFLSQAVGAAHAAGTVMVAPSGNIADNKVFYPAKYPEVIAVGAVDNNDIIWYDELNDSGGEPVNVQGSNYGPALDLVAPGALVNSGFVGEDGEGYEMVTGTSYAAAMVAGAAALFLSLDNTLTPEEIRSYLKDGADRVPGTNGDPDNKYGAGRLNIYQSLKLRFPGYEFIKVTDFDAESSEDWKTFNYNQLYTNPIVVASPLTVNDQEPAHIRIRNVTPTGFQAKIEEWSNSAFSPDRGQHFKETVFFMVMEKGLHYIGGRHWQAGSAQVNNQDWKKVTLDNAFAGAQTVLPQVVTTTPHVKNSNSNHAVVVRLKEIDGKHFKMLLQEAEVNQKGGVVHPDETVHFIAVQHDNGKSGSTNFISFETGWTMAKDTEVAPVSFSKKYGDIYFFAQLSTFNEDDTCNVRNAWDVPLQDSKTASIVLEEDFSSDTSDNRDATHATEKVRWLVVDPGKLGRLVSSNDSDDSGDPVNKPGVNFVSLSTLNLDKNYSSIYIEAEASSKKKISKVELYLDGQLVRKDTSPKYKWDQADPDLVGLKPGTYDLKLKATDKKGATAQAFETLTIGGGAGNQSPKVYFDELSTLHLDKKYKSITVAADAYDPDGSIAHVELYLDGDFVGRQKTQAYKWSGGKKLMGLKPGSYELKLKATDNQGAIAQAFETLSVGGSGSGPGGGGNKPPAVSFKPSSTLDLDKGYKFMTIEAEASDPDGNIAQVELFVGNKSKGKQTKPSYKWSGKNLLGLGKGTHQIELKATDNQGATSQAFATLSVGGSGSGPGGGGNKPPTVSFKSSSTLDLNKGYGKSSLLIEAKASDADGSVTQVELYLGNKSVGRQGGAPYLWKSINNKRLQGLATGTYKLKLVATDNDGATAQATKNLTVKSTQAKKR
ncbi:MAG: S8 family serine peptidase [Verrucomicrobiota bacterium]